MSELFEKFEVNRESRSQVLTKLVGASLVIHLVLLWLVVSVPALRSSLNIAALIAHTRFVDKDYEATQIADQVQLVQLEKFHYPEGYFALEAQINGQLPTQAAALDPFAPKIISQASKERNVAPEASPSPSPAASASPAPSPAPSASPSAAIAQASPSASPLSPEEAQKQLEKTAEENNVAIPGENEINKKALKDFAAYASELKKQRMALVQKDNPDANCLPMGFLQFHLQPQPRKIVQTPQLVLIEYEANYGIRHIYTDGRKLPPQGEVQPWWYGYSVGHWEGNDLVVETNNLRGAEESVYDGWLDVNGSPYSNGARMTERFRRPSFGHLQIDMTVEDAKSYTRPWTVRVDQRILPDQELIEFVCNENQQFRRRIKID